MVRYWAIGVLGTLLLLAACAPQPTEQAAPSRDTADSAPTSSTTSQVAADPPPTASCSEVQTFPIQGRQHVKVGEPHPAYNSKPPTSGWHLQRAADWQVYSEPLSDELQVHNLEHGGILIQYNSIPQDHVSELEELLRADPRHLIVAPYPNMDGAITLTAWGKLQTCTQPDAEAIKAFVAVYRDKGPEFIP